MGRDRTFNVRLWVELNVRAPSPERAEELALESVRRRHLPPRPEEWQAAAFGSQPCPSEPDGPGTPKN